MPKASNAATTKKAATPSRAAAKGAAKTAAAKATKATKAAKTPAKATKAAKATKSPAKTTAKATKAPAKSAKTPAKAAKTPAKTTKATKATKAAEAAVKPQPRTMGAANIPPKRPGAPTPVAKKAPGPLSEADKKFFAEQKKLLLEERESYDRQATELKAEADQLAAEMEPGDVQFDEESGEGDSIGMERERDLQLAGQARAAIEEIDRALAKVANGTYGTCERCHQPIPKPRLKALPYAALCVACKSGGLSSRR